MLEENLQVAILTYKNLKKAFDACSDLHLSHGVSRESQEISNAYFAARANLEFCCNRSNNSLAQEYFTKAQLAHECAKLMCDRQFNRSDECARRMSEYDDVKNRLLEKVS